MRILLAIAVCASLGCGSKCPDAAPKDPSAEPPRGSPPAPGPTDTSLPGQGPRHMWVALEAPVTHVDDDDIAHYATDRVAVVTQVPFPLYLYLLKIDAEGTIEIVYPAGPPELVSGPVRMPAEGWVERAAPPGRESLVVVTVLEGETYDKQFVREMAGRAAEGPYTQSLTVHGEDALRADVWAEDETLIWIEIDPKSQFALRD
jgi:hypothetical protein